MHSIGNTHPCHVGLLQARAAAGAKRVAAPADVAAKRVAAAADVPRPAKHPRLEGLGIDQQVGPMLRRCPYVLCPSVHALYTYRCAHRQVCFLMRVGLPYVQTTKTIECAGAVIWIIHTHPICPMVVLQASRSF